MTAEMAARASRALLVVVTLGLSAYVGAVTYAIVTDPNVTPERHADPRHYCVTDVLPGVSRPMVPAP